MSRESKRDGDTIMEFLYDDLIGIPFADGGRDPKKGLDCWGLVKEAFRRQGYAVQDYNISAAKAANIAWTMKKQENDWIHLNEPRVGCLVLLRLTPRLWANHVGIYIGDGKFLHAYLPTGVCIDRLRRWQSRIVGYYSPGGGWH